MSQRSPCQSALLLFSFIVTGCLPLVLDPVDNNLPPVRHMSKATVMDLVMPELSNLPEPEQMPVVAIYDGAFMDHTGQRLSNSQFASFSTAITQSPESFLIRALKRASNGNFFHVVERVGLEHVTRERQLIRNTRANFDDESPLMPLRFAGLLLEGGGTNFQANERSAGLGARLLSIGTTRQYREDTVTVALRMVSVSTGDVLLEVLVTKTILSASLSQDLFRFVSSSTELIEVEGGVTRNESMTLALAGAIEMAVFNLINEGEKNAFWSFK